MTKAATVLAACVVKAMQMREESYDHTASDAASAAGEEARKANPGNIYAGLVDYAQFYQMTMLQAAQAACKQEGEAAEGLVQPVFLLCECGWNDAQDWAVEEQAVAQIQGR